MEAEQRGVLCAYGVVLQLWVCVASWPLAVFHLSRLEGYFKGLFWHSGLSHNCNSGSLQWVCHFTCRLLGFRPCFLLMWLPGCHRMAGARAPTTYVGH